MSSLNSRVDLAAISQREVLDRRGKPLGRIMEVFLDMDDGRVECATLQLLSDKPNTCRYLVIPWSQFGMSSNGEHLELDISRAVLESVASRHPRKLPESH